jgi:hypothetical protein
MKKTLIQLLELAFRPLLILALIQLCSCYNINGDEVVLTNYSSTDTDTAFVICGVENPVVFERQQPAYINLLDFIDFSRSHCSVPSFFEKTQRVDTTGDGQLELVKTKVMLSAAGCIIQNSILKGSLKIWEDELLIDHEYAAQLFGGKTNYIRNYPASSLYLGLLHWEFIDELGSVQKQSFDVRKKALLRQLASDQHNIQELSTIYGSQLAKTMENYQGKYIFALGLGKRAIHMWDSATNSFIPVFHT